MIRPGQMLIELLLALAVAMVAITALASVTTLSIANTGLAKRQTQATNYAQEALEWARSQREVLGWDTYTILGGYYCMDDLSWGSGNEIVTPCLSGNKIPGTNFIRYVHVTLNTATVTPTDDKLLEAVVTWGEGSRVHTVKQTTVLASP